MGSNRIVNGARQRGLGFIGLVLVGALLVALFAVVGQMFPTVLEYRAAVKAIERAKVQTSIPAARADFDRAAAIDDIRTISGKDLDITKNGDELTISFDYTREIALAGPAFLLLKYKATTAKAPAAGKRGI